MRRVAGVLAVSLAVVLAASALCLSEAGEVGRVAAAEGRSLEDMLAGARLTEDAGYEPGGLPPFVTVGRDDVLQWAWEEATGSAVPAEVPRADSAVEEDGW